MALSTIRKMNDEDQKRLDAAAKRFIKRHYSDYLNKIDNLESATDIVETLVMQDTDNGSMDLRRKWAYAMCRAFRVRNNVRIAIGYDYIGISVD